MLDDAAGSREGSCMYGGCHVKRRLADDVRPVNAGRHLASGWVPGNRAGEAAAAPAQDDFCRQAQALNAARTCRPCAAPPSSSPRSRPSPPGPAESAGKGGGGGPSLTGGQAAGSSKLAKGCRGSLLRTSISLHQQVLQLLQPRCGRTGAAGSINNDA